MPKTKSRVERPAKTAALHTAPPAGGWTALRYGLALAGTFAVVALVYGPALGGPFVFDDLYLPFTFQEFANAPLLHWIRGVRPFLMFTFWVNHKLSGMEPFSYHVVNLLLHFLTGICSFLIVRRLLERVGESGARRDLLAGFAAAVFLLHPLQTESAAYVASRSEVLSVFFFYAAFTVFLYRRHEAISWLESIAVLVLFAAAVTTKEHTAVLPALLLLTDCYWHPGFSFRGIGRNWKLYALTAAGGAAAASMVWDVLRKANTAGFALKDFTWVQYFYTQCRAIWFYVRLYVMPYGQNVDHDFRPSYTVLDHGAIVGLAALVIVVGAAIWFRKRFPLASYGVLVFLLLIAPTSSFIPIQDPVAERRLYLPFVGLLLVTVDLVRRWKTSPGTVKAALAAVLVVLGYVTFARAAVWSSNVALWEDSVSKSPNKDRPQFQLAFAYYELGRCQAALPHYAAAARAARPDYRLLTDWAIAYDCAGNQPAALDKLRQAEWLARTAQLYSLFAMVYIHQSDWNNALAALAKAERIDPNYENTYMYRGSVFFSQGDLNAAANEFRRALAVNPQSEQARLGLAQVQQRQASGR